MNVSDVLYLELPECGLERFEGDVNVAEWTDDKMVLLHSVLAEFVHCEHSKLI